MWALCQAHCKRTAHAVSPRSHITQAVGSASHSAFLHSYPALAPLAAAASALAALQAKRDSLQKRTESLIRLKNEFQELSKVL